MFNHKEGFRDLPVTVPCGQCIGCRLKRAQSWAIRCVHEAQLHEDSCFLTLTYSDEHLPHDGSLNKAHFQKFMKRLRKRFDGQKIRYFHCGEYGGEGGRPHYHALIFGLDFADKIYTQERNGNRCYISPTLTQLWPFGFHELGSITFESAGYVARYCVEKITGDKAEEYYQSVDFYGEIHRIEPPYVTMSRAEGIGSKWYEKFKGDVFPSDEIVIQGRVLKPPPYYDKLLEKECIATYNSLKKRRLKEQQKYVDNTTPERLRVREKVKQSKVKQLKRAIR